jgi:hypothetical protein
MLFTNRGRKVLHASTHNDGRRCCRFDSALLLFLFRVARRRKLYAGQERKRDTVLERVILLGFIIFIESQLPTNSS